MHLTIDITEARRNLEPRVSSYVNCLQFRQIVNDHGYIPFTLIYATQIVFIIIFTISCTKT